MIVNPEHILLALARHSRLTYLYRMDAKEVVLEFVRSMNHLDPSLNLTLASFTNGESFDKSTDKLMNQLPTNYPPRIDGRHPK